MKLNIRSSRTTFIGSILFILAAIIYVLTEAIAAYAWQTPPYRYAYNYISDLGVAGPLNIDGREVFSPLAYVMNFGFMMHGILFALGYGFALPLLTGKSKWIAFAAACVHGIGNILIGIFPGVSYEGVSPHLTGAALAIIGGNLALIFAGLSLRSLYPRLRWVGVGLGIFGILALLIMVSDLFGHPAVFERLSVYTMTAWDLIFGISLLIASGVRSKSIFS
ncbi:DUF998 domain-containing protein [Saccharibacillus sp. JS10]|uniref:DUF998 domain-containing protein n=1 Tax=Saccharibacillus sp. JS10 TaxID=2950552 RepID=UPI002108C310|nr:DUF998 domain-containing protein [Saccharibacillus sp. JS10]MCQ4086475.1 DUF998 domain-containing protein [Saccharibacillus sp. JS10]